VRNYTSIRLDEHNCLAFESDVGRTLLFLKMEDLEELYDIMLDFKWEHN
jgi:hypothetical protein